MSSPTKFKWFQPPVLQDFAIPGIVFQLFLNNASIYQTAK